jgi:hypothetical protein
MPVLNLDTATFSPWREKHLGERFSSIAKSRQARTPGRARLQIDAHPPPCIAIAH